MAWPLCRPTALAAAVVLAVSCLRAAAVDTEHEDMGLTTTLNKDSFDGYLAGQLSTGRAALVMFHVNWCKVCQKTFPKFAASSNVVADNKIALDFAHVDCTNEKTLCQRYNVKGYPTIKYFPAKADAEPSNFRSQRTEEGFLKYARRMTLPHVKALADPAAVVEAMREETYSAFLVAADSSEAAPAGFVAAAERWRDRHLFIAVPSLQAVLPESISVPAGATIAVLSNAAQQWSGATGGAPAAAFYDGSAAEVDAVEKWVQRSRFPGVWSLGELTFYEFTHSGRSAAMVTLDPSNVSADQELFVRGAAESLTENYIFGVLDGISWKEELSDFNLYSADLPRVLVSVDDFEGWYEDIEELRLETLARDLKELHSGDRPLLLQGRGPLQRLQLYKREGLRKAEHLYVYAQRGPREAALASAAVAAGMALVMTAGWCAVACCRVLLSEDAEPWDRHQAHVKRE